MYTDVRNDMNKSVYIAPTSSPYYSESDIAVIQSKCKTRNTNKNIVYTSDL